MALTGRPLRGFKVFVGMAGVALGLLGGSFVLQAWASFILKRSSQPGPRGAAADVIEWLPSGKLAFLTAALVFAVIAFCLYRRAPHEHGDERQSSEGSGDVHAVRAEKTIRIDEPDDGTSQMKSAPRTRAASER